jgi:hypothetical protein
MPSLAERWTKVRASGPSLFQERETYPNQSPRSFMLRQPEPRGGIALTD